MNRQNPMPSAQERAPKPKCSPVLGVNPRVQKFKSEALIRETMRVTMTPQEMELILRDHINKVYPDFSVTEIEIRTSGHEILTEIEFTLVSEREEVNGHKK